MTEHKPVKTAAELIATSARSLQQDEEVRITIFNYALYQAAIYPVILAPVMAALGITMQDYAFSVETDNNLPVGSPITLVIKRVRI